MRQPPREKGRRNGLALNPGWAGNCDPNLSRNPSRISPYQRSHEVDRGSCVYDATGSATEVCKLNTASGARLEPKQPDAIDGKLFSLKADKLHPLEHEDLSQVPEWPMESMPAGNPVTLETRQQWVSMPGTNAEPSHWCCDPS